MFFRPLSLERTLALEQPAEIRGGEDGAAGEGHGAVLCTCGAASAGRSPGGQGFLSTPPWGVPCGE